MNGRPPGTGDPDSRRAAEAAPRDAPRQAQPVQGYAGRPYTYPQGPPPQQGYPAAGNAARGYQAPQGQQPPPQGPPPRGPPPQAQPGPPQSGPRSPDQPPIPNVDVIETPDAVSVLVDIPGCEEDDIRIRAENGTLTVLATRREEADEEATVYLQERPHKFERTVDLPAEADIEGASAEYETGVCTIELPKTEGQKRREIGFQ